MRWVGWGGSALSTGDNSGKEWTSPSKGTPKKFDARWDEIEGVLLENKTDGLGDLEMSP